MASVAAADPFTAWREMREREGPRVSLIRLYALVAEPRGLKPHELPLAERKELAGRAAPLLWPGFQQNPRSQPREPMPVHVVAYDPGWPERFEAWRGRLAGAAYTEAKSDVVLGILDQAEAWAGATGWAV
jgi:hypothetical protein